MSCPACGARSPRGAVTVSGFRWLRCGGCGSLFVERPPPDEQIASLYQGERYFARGRLRGSNGRVLGYHDYMADRDRIEAKFEAVLARLERHGTGRELLDVGAGPGFLVAAAERRGWAASGVELNAWAAAHAREELGVDVRCGAFGSMPIEPWRYGAVTMMDLIEHLPRPGEAVAEAARVSQPGGLLAIITPDACSPAGRLLGSRWPELIRAPGHLVLFSRAGLARLLRRHGYEVLGWHSVGKTTRLEALIADASPAAPALAGSLGRLVGLGSLGDRVVTVDPRTKFCLYARRSHEPEPESV